MGCGECSGGAYALANVGGAILTLGNVDLHALGVGGAGGTGGAGQPGGSGGTGYGGWSQAGLVDNSLTNCTTGRATFGDITLVSNGFGGAGGASLFEQGDGGDAYGGNAWLKSYASDATASTSVSLPRGWAATAGSSAATVLAARSQLLRTADISTSPTRSRPSPTLPPERRTRREPAEAGSAAISI